MNFNILPNGNLEITRDFEDIEDLDAILERITSDYGMAVEICEMTGWAGNGDLFAVRPEWIGALTEAPIFTDDIEYVGDTLEPLVRGNVWWFPNYTVECPLSTLISSGRVVFQKS